MKKLFLISVFLVLTLAGCNDKDDSSISNRSEYAPDSITSEITAHSSTDKENKTSSKTTISESKYKQTKKNITTHNKKENIEFTSSQERIEDDLPIITEIAENNKSNDTETAMSSLTTVKSDFSNVKKTIKSNTDVIELPFIPAE